MSSCPSVLAALKELADAVWHGRGGRLLTAEMFQDGDDVVLWIVEHGVWPSSENLPLFYGYCASLGEMRPLREVPCHLIGRNSTWLRIYNSERPHDSLGQVPPLTFLPRPSTTGESLFALST